MNQQGSCFVICYALCPDWITKEIFPAGFEGHHRSQTSLCFKKNCLFLDQRVVIPEQGRNEILLELQEANFGVVRMKTLARSYVWLPNINIDIEAKVSDCGLCLFNSPSSPVLELHPWKHPNRAWVCVHADYAGSFMGQMF